MDIGLSSLRIPYNVYNLRSAIFENHQFFHPAVANICFIEFTNPGMYWVVLQHMIIHKTKGGLEGGAGVARAPPLFAGPFNLIIP